MHTIIKIKIERKDKFHLSYLIYLFLEEDVDHLTMGRYPNQDCDSIDFASLCFSIFLFFYFYYYNKPNYYLQIVHMYRWQI